MTLTPTNLTALAGLAVAVLVMAAQDDPRWFRWLRRKWNTKVGAWFARRRIVGAFNSRRHKLIRIDNPDEHSKGIMVMRRDVSTGWWT